MNPIPKHPKKEMTLHTRSFSKLGYRTDPVCVACNLSSPTDFS
jgi:hypothetical protein